MPYWSALVFGFYYYVVFQLIYLWRFGSLNFRFGFLDLMLPIIGIASVLLLVYFSRKIPARKNLLFIPFLIALPLSVVGALMGGLFGLIGMLVFALLPFAAALTLGYWLIKRRGTSLKPAV